MIILGKPNNHFYIEGLPPEEYAALWGDGKTEAGCLFYNFGSDSIIRDKEWLNKFNIAVFDLYLIIQKSEIYSDLQKDLADLTKLFNYVNFLFRINHILVYKGSTRKGDKLKVTSTSYSVTSKSLIFRLEKDGDDFGAYLCHKFDEQFVKFSGFEGVFV